MQANKLTKVLLTAGLVFSMQSQATDVDLGLNFTTIADVSITQVTALDMGTDLAVASSSACSMAVNNATAKPSEVAGQIANTGAAEDAGYAALTGNCDTSVKGTPGVYRITGAPGLDVAITLNFLNGTDITFSPIGVASDYDNAGTNNGDGFTDITTGGGEDVRFANANDESFRTVGGFPTAGEVMLFVGGTVTAKNTLNTAQTYTEQFVIDANYN
jgi:hypothetical protein